MTVDAHEIAWTCIKYLGVEGAYRYCLSIARNKGADEANYKQAAEIIKARNTEVFAK